MVALPADAHREMEAEIERQRQQAQVLAEQAAAARRSLRRVAGADAADGSKKVRGLRSGVLWPAQLKAVRARSSSVLELQGPESPQGHCTGPGTACSSLASWQHAQDIVVQHEVHLQTPALQGKEGWITPVMQSAPGSRRASAYLPGGMGPAPQSAPGSRRSSAHWAPADGGDFAAPPAVQAAVWSASQMGPSGLQHGPVSGAAGDCYCLALLLLLQHACCQVGQQLQLVQQRAASVVDAGHTAPDAASCLTAQQHNNL